MFHAIGKTVNAPSKVLLARSRSRQEDAEGIPKLFGWVFSDYIIVLFVTAPARALPANMGTPTVCSAAMSLGSELAPQSRIKSQASAQGQPGGIRTGRRPQFESSAQNREPDEFSMGGARN